MVSSNFVFRAILVGFAIVALGCGNAAKPANTAGSGGAGANGGASGRGGAGGATSGDAGGSDSSGRTDGAAGATGSDSPIGGGASTGGIAGFGGGSPSGGASAPGGQIEGKGGASAAGGMAGSAGGGAGAGGMANGGAPGSGGLSGSGGARSSGGASDPGGVPAGGSVSGGAGGGVPAGGGGVPAGGAAGGSGGSANGGAGGSGGSASGGASGGGGGSGGVIATGGATATGGAGGSTGNGPIALSWDFASTTEGWAGDFSDYPPNIGTGYDLTYRWSALPAEVGPGGGLFMSGSNHSDDLFMYIKRQITGLAHGAEYVLDVSVTIDSNAPGTCGGIGGSPGESVFVKIGSVPFEPTASLNAAGRLILNLDKGNQSVGGVDMKVVGNISNTLTCPSPAYQSKTLNLVGFNASTASDGTLWIAIGTDSGFEGVTSLYYDRIAITLTPSSGPTL